MLENSKNPLDVNSYINSSTQIPAIVQAGNFSPRQQSPDALPKDPRLQRIQWELAERLGIAAIEGDFSAYGVMVSGAKNESDQNSQQRQILAMLGEEQTQKLFQQFQKAAALEKNPPVVEICLSAGNKSYWAEQSTVIQKDASGQVRVFSFWQNKTLQKEAENSTAIFSQVIEAIPSWVFLKNKDHEYELVNSSYASVYGVSPEECIGKNSIDLGVPEELVLGDSVKGIRGFWADDKEVFENGAPRDIQCEPIVIDGQQRFLQTRKTPIKDAQTGRDLLVGFCHDITYMKRIETQIGIELRHNKTLNEVNQLLRCTEDPFEALDNVCQLLSRVVGCQKVLIQMISTGQFWAFGETNADQHSHSTAIEFDHVKMASLTVFFNQPNDLSSHDETLLSAVSAKLAVAFHRQDLMSKINHQANHDSLTNLPNRHNILLQIKNAIDQSQNNSRLCAVVILDLDGFKLVNDTFGHEVGDQLLLAVSNRLKRIANYGESPARLGGDEFAILLSNVESRENAIERAKFFLNALQNPFEVNDRELYVGASLGISFYPEDSVDETSMLRNADWAMYLAKAKGRNSCEPFTEEIAQETLRKVLLENDLRKAIQSGTELFMVFQPKLNMTSMEVTSVEALIRWNHPVHGLILPGEFIPIAERTGLIIQLGEWIMLQSCNIVAQWNQRLNRKIQLAINITPPELEERGLVNRIKHVLEVTGLEPEYLDLELTETFVMERFDEVSMHLQELRELGVKISLDDFGTGYSCMSYLHRLPVDCLKIDRAFIEILDSDLEDSRHAAITRTIVALAKSLKLETVAEGVETADQLRQIQTLGVDTAQGFLFSPGLIHGEALAFICEKNGEPTTN